MSETRGSDVDDPREIIKAAGVECAEVEAWAEKVYTGEFSELQTEREALSIIGPLREVVVTSNNAVLALARLVAELKRQLDDRTERVKQAIERSRVTAVSPEDVLNLIDRVALMQDDEKRDAYLAAKYKWQRGKLTERLLTERIASFTRGLSDDDEQQAIADAYRWKDRICTALDEEWEEHDA